ncbi:hypothetical protein IZ6_11470 [Terrihabitans soli]|uniref:Uncharacterized protein n=1 Tax=Terrihabitans soli TaxID=708113 RepID=A0A6S6QT27_9HYPH|nr:hypothetical protein IZ6_11470 [Terrihabitans soli]
MTAVLKHAFGDRAHKAHAAAAIDEAHFIFREILSEGEGGCFVTGVPAEPGPAIHTH